MSTDEVNKILNADIDKIEINFDSTVANIKIYFKEIDKHFEYAVDLPYTKVNKIDAILDGLGSLILNKFNNLEYKNSLQ